MRRGSPLLLWVLFVVQPPQHKIRDTTWMTLTGAITIVLRTNGVPIVANSAKEILKLFNCLLESFRIGRLGNHENDSLVVVARALSRLHQGRSGREGESEGGSGNRELHGGLFVGWCGVFALEWLL
jgi:hypothetical protein